MNASKIVRIRSESRLGKWEAHSAMIRLARDLAERIEEAGNLSSEDKIAIDNVICAFTAQLPEKVKDDVKHG